jgi:hypothetical protein
MRGEHTGYNVMFQHLIESSPMDDYDGRTSKEIHYLIYDPFCDKSPLQLQKAGNSQLNHVPILNVVKYFLGLLKELQQIKLNSKGGLPLKIARNILSQNFFVEEHDFLNETSFVKHTEVPLIKNIIQLAEINNLVFIENQVVLLSEKGSIYKRNKLNFELFQGLFNAYTQKLNWSANDVYGDNHIGQFGFAYTLDLISKYGDTPRPVTFYSEKYYRAFSNLLNGMSKEDYSYTKGIFFKCYTIRTFVRFLQVFGLVNLIYDSHAPDLDFSVVKSDIFDSLFKFE